MMYKTWVMCKCDSVHRSYSTWAKCVWPYARISGQGQWALVKPCRVPVGGYKTRSDWNVWLYEDYEAAAKEATYSSGTCDKNKFFLIKIER